MERRALTDFPAENPITRSPDNLPAMFGAAVEFAEDGAGGKAVMPSAGRMIAPGRFSSAASALWQATGGW